MELMAVGQGRVFCPALPSFPIKLNSTLYAHATAQKKEEENLFPASARHTFKAPLFQHSQPHENSAVNNHIVLLLEGRSSPR